MLQVLSDWVYRLPQGIHNFLSRRWYENMSRLDRDADMIFMNYGWVDLNPAAPSLSLRPEDEANRYSIQLYHRVASAVPLAGADVLEVGSGRGGGASYIMRYLGPRNLVGLDLTPQSIAFCQQHHSLPGLRFVQGKAEALDFPPETFDAVINIESSHCYAPLSAFLEGVHRVLKPGGHFLFADHRDAAQIAGLRQSLTKAGLLILEEENISANVVRALELDNARKQTLINQKVPKLLRHFFNEFAGMQGTHSLYATLRKGEKVYMRFVLTKRVAGLHDK